MKYLVTYGAIDSEFGNPGWHSFMLLSKVEEGKKIEVIDQYGFYGLPSTERADCLSKLKINLRLDVDMKGNHGMLRHEDLRYLDMGVALHGVTFEVTEAQLNALQEKCKMMMANQNSAINEVVESQGIRGEENFRIYPHEKYSRTIFEIEKIKAKQENRVPRLKPFEIILTMTPKGLALNQSYTCKSETISLLKGILSDAQINRLTEYGKHPTIPKYSGPMEKIYLHSSGPMREHKKQSGKVVYYRDFTDPNVKLHWTLPPQEIETLNAGTDNLLKISPEYCADAKKIVHKLQRLYWLFMNASLPEKYKDYQKQLVQYIQEHYEAFAIMTEPRKKTSHRGVNAYVFSLFSLPRDEDEAILLKNIQQGKMLMNNLYMAITNHWEMEDDDKEDPNLEALASYLTIEDQKALCKMIGRRYVTPELEMPLLQRKC